MVMQTLNENASNRSPFSLSLAGIVALILISSSVVFAQTTANRSSQSATPQVVQHLNVLGTTTIRAEPFGTGAFQFPETPDQAGQGLLGYDAARISPSATTTLTRRSNLPIPGKEAARKALALRGAAREAAASLPLPEPSARNSTVVNYQDAGFIGFKGLDDVDQRSANNGNQYSLEPPDQGLCVGNGFVVETVNDVIRVYDKVGNPLTGVEDMNSFFGLAPAIIRGTPNITGPFLSDPRCFYDTQTRTWFVSELDEDTGSNIGATGRNYNLIAVSQTPDPTGPFTVFQYDVTDDGMDGTPAHPGCPCFGDQPLIGADRYGFYQVTNEYGAGVFNGAQIYAISKAALVAAANPANTNPVLLVQIDASQALLPYGGLSYSIQPARSPMTTDDPAVPSGVEYFLSALQFGNPGYEVYDNRIAVWALSNTKSLNTPFPFLNLFFQIVHTETYGQPDSANQKSGEYPLGTALGDPLEQLQTNDDRMNQATYSQGILYGEVNSKLKVGGGDQTGAAWFAIRPSFNGPMLEGSVVAQGYVATKGNNVIFPSIGVDRNGGGAVVYTLVGPDYFPSVAYSPLNDVTVSNFIHIAAAGQDPDDGFTGYAQYGGTGAGRWGDYSAATWDGNRVWFASEYIPFACAVNAPPCREVLFNWGSSIGSIIP